MTLTWATWAAGFTLCMTLFNLLTWPRGRVARAPASCSILIPARNEEDSIEVCVTAAARSLEAAGEVIVGNDHSTDATASILRTMAATHPNLRVITPPPLPSDCVGKPHNCHHLSLAATGEHLVFVDADVTLREDAMQRLGDLHERYGADLVTVFPHQETQTFLERHLMPLLAMTYTSWLPLPLVWATRHPALLAANGQIVSVSRRAYEAMGGFHAVRAEVVDDMAFCRRAKEHGLRVVFAEGSDIASCRMYGSAGDLWKGFTKNIYEGLGESPLRLAGVLVAYSWAFLLPWFLLLGSALGHPEWLAPGLIGVAANLVLRISLALRFGHSWGSVLTHPFAVIAFMALAVDSARKTVTGGVRWAGRSYRRRADRWMA